jgi:hypothetical protein
MSKSSIAVGFGVAWRARVALLLALCRPYFTSLQGAAGDNTAPTKKMFLMFFYDIFFIRQDSGSATRPALRTLVAPSPKTGRYALFFVLYTLQNIIAIPSASCIVLVVDKSLCFESMQFKCIILMHEVEKHLLVSRALCVLGALKRFRGKARTFAFRTKTY